MSEHSSDIRECLVRANECQQKARTERDPALQRDYLEFERRWRMLARGYELANRLDALGHSTFPAGPSKTAA
jgi:hypothetical protein